MRFLASIFIAILTCTTVANAQSNDPEEPAAAALEAMFKVLASSETLLPKIAGDYGFAGNAQGVYADHLKKTFLDPDIRDFLVRSYKGQVSVKENGNVTLQSYQDVMGALRGRLMLLSSEGASRLPIDDLVQYQAILQKALLAVSEKGIEECLDTGQAYISVRQPTSNRRDALYTRFGALQALDAKSLHTFLQYHRDAIRHFWLDTGAQLQLQGQGLEIAQGIANAELDRLAADHPNKAGLEAAWYDGDKTSENVCDTLKLDWQLLENLSGDQARFVALYMHELMEGLYAE